MTATARTQPGMVGTSAGVGLDAIADFRYDLAVGDDTLTADELIALAELKSPLVRLRGQWVELDPRRLAAALRMAGRDGRAVGRRAAPPRSRRRHPRRRGGGDRRRRGRLAGRPAGRTRVERRLGRQRAGGLPAARCGRTRNAVWPGWRSWSRSGSAACSPTTWVWARPSSCWPCWRWPATPRRRRRGRRPCWSARCRWSATGSARRPASPRSCGCTSTTAPSEPAARPSDEAVAASDLVVTTYGLVARDVEALREISWRRRGARRGPGDQERGHRRPRVAVRSLPAPHRIAVTGTPVENRLGDLWSIMEFANPGLLGQRHVVQEAVRDADRAARR